MINFCCMFRRTSTAFKRNIHEAPYDSLKDKYQQFFRCLSCKKEKSDSIHLLDDFRKDFKRHFKARNQ